MKELFNEILTTNKSERCRTNVTYGQICSISYTDLILTMVVLRREIEMLELTSNVMSYSGIGVPIVFSRQDRGRVISQWTVLGFRWRCQFLPLIASEGSVAQLATNQTCRS
jgi:hypothetical protein